MGQWDLITSHPASSPALPLLGSAVCPRGLSLRPGTCPARVTSILLIMLLSTPSVPSQPPENVRAISITSDVAVISWSEPPRSTLNGVLKGYRVIFWSLYMDGGECSWWHGGHWG